MKKNIILKLVLVAFILFGLSTLYAQSDYEVTRNFKEAIIQLTDSIKNAQNLDECLELENAIAQLQEDNTSHKDLLNKSLYPDSFNTSIEKLTNLLNTRKGDFLQISDLKTEVKVLKDEISDLNRMNSSLLAEIKVMESKQSKDATVIDSLKTLVSNLRSSIKKRDDLVLSIIDSLVNAYIASPSTLNEAESQKFINNIENKNVFFNVRRTIDDNIEFMKVTTLTYNDLSELKKHQVEFSRLWRQIGSKMAEVYLKRNEKAIEIGQIDGMFREWSRRIDSKIWGTIDQLFKNKDISLLKFVNGDEFEQSVSSYITDEIKNAEIKGKDESEELFNKFTYSVWFNDVKQDWVPMLIENEMMTPANKDSIESKIAKWQKVVAPPSYAWLYWLIGIIVLALILMFFKWDKKKEVVSSPKEEQK